MKGNCGECERRYTCVIVDVDNCDEWPDPAPKTNADRRREQLKNDEQLAALYVRYNSDTDLYHTDVGAYHDFEGAMDAELEWLQQPAEVD